MSITPAQCRAARGLLGINQGQLSEAAGVSLRSLTNFERGVVKPHRATVEALTRAMEAAGVAFVEDYGVYLRAEARNEPSKAA